MLPDQLGHREPDRLDKKEAIPGGETALLLSKKPREKKAEGDGAAVAIYAIRARDQHKASVGNRVTKQQQRKRDEFCIFQKNIFREG
jgi:hypothetical protein